jgi:hypothetical protein
MTQIQWFAFVILPACLAMIAFATARLFERLHPIPVAEGSPEADLRDVRSTGFAEAPADYTARISDRKTPPSV